MNEVTAPSEFHRYQKWIKTKEGRRWWAEQASKDNDRYRCDSCGAIVWYPRIEGLEYLNCGSPCFGVMRRSER